MGIVSLVTGLKKLTVSQKEQIEQTDFCMLGEIQEG